MRDALAFENVSIREINEGYRSLIDLLQSLDPSVQSSIANSIWYRNGFPVHQKFLDTTSRYFDATSQALDFGNAPASLATINGWVNTRTNGRIPTILDEIRNDHIMFLINAIYFKGDWRSKFDKSKTRTSVFHAVNGDQNVQMMFRHDTTAYLAADTFDAVELPYGNGAFVMNVLMPSHGIGIDAFAASLPLSALESSNYRKYKMIFEMPRLKVEYERELEDDLMSLGMLAPFDAAGADFTEMSPRGDELFIDFVRQKTFVQVDEEGTEAAAVTAVGVVLTSAPPSMVVDRPYVFVLRERLTGTILFIGKITNVTQ
jgi:serpin B